MNKPQTTPQTTYRVYEQARLPLPQVRVFKNANDLYYSLFDYFLEKITPLENPNIALATGNTMIPLYRLMTAQQGRFNSARWTCFQLDEYYPISEETKEISFQHYLYQHLFNHLQLQPKKNLFSTSPGVSLDVEIQKTEDEIARLSGIDFGFLGLGRNGHVAFNEPGSKKDSTLRIIDLHQDTLLANFGAQAPVTQALTMGIKTILEIKNLAIVAIGKTKAAAVRAALHEPESSSCPASFLISHPSMTWFIDEDAASAL